MRNLTILLSVISLNLFATSALFAEEPTPALQQLNSSIEKSHISFWGGYSILVSVVSGSNGLNSKDLTQEGLVGVKIQPFYKLTLDASWQYTKVDVDYSPDNGRYEYNGMYRGLTSLDLFDDQVRLSGGRRPIGDSVPLNTIPNESEHDNYDNKSILANFHFDGAAITVKPQALDNWGTFLQFSYGYRNGLNSLGHQSDPYSFYPLNSTIHTNIIGLSLTPFSNKVFDSWIKWNRVKNIKDFPVMEDTAFGNTPPAVKLGYIDWVTTGIKYKHQGGPGLLNLNLEGGSSTSHPNGNLSPSALNAGLLYWPSSPEPPSSKTGYAALLGIRYDFPSYTKVGFEYSLGSKYWISPDTSPGKIGTRGASYEPFIIQEINIKPINSVFKRVFLRIGYQYCDYSYTNSNSWLGAPVKISELTNNTMLLITPITHTNYTYGSIEVHF